MKYFSLTILSVKCSLSILLYFFLALAIPAKAAQGGRDSLAFLNLGMGARPMAMGGAFTAVADDINSLFYNPAGLSSLDNFEASLLHQRWIAGLSYSYFGMAAPIKRVGTFAGSFLYLGTPAVQAFDKFNQPAGTFKANDQAFSVSYGRRIAAGLSGGISTKFIREVLHQSSANAFSFDLGGLYRFSDSMQVGIFLGNIGTSLKHHKESLLDGSRQAGIIRMGISSRIANPDILTSVELTKQFDDDPEILVGAEYKVANILALRIGYSHETGGRGIKGITGIAGGIGFTSSLVRVDYALSPWGDLGLTHMIGFTYSGEPRTSQNGSGARARTVPEAPMKEILNLIFVGREDDALTKLGELAVTWPNDAKIFLYTGMALQRMGRTGEAMLYYKAARDFSKPGSEVRESAKRNLGVLEPWLQ